MKTTFLSLLIAAVMAVIFSAKAAAECPLWIPPETCELAEQGDARAQYVLGASYFYGEGAAKDPREAVRWFRMAAEQGYAAAQYNLGLAYNFGDGVAKDPREAVRWFRKAAEQGNAWAQYNVGAAYHFGNGVAKDPREAVRWFRMAAEQGDVGGQFSLGVAYDLGDGVAKDPREAVRWFRMAAEQGNVGGQFGLGEAYSRGEGVAKDWREAVHWYRKAAEQGNMGGQFGLGVAYSFGEGVAKDPREAVRWFRMAAEQGLADAQFNLGVSYKKGEGVTKDLREAVRWYRKAAEQGLAKAQDQLGGAYEKGEGVITDKREAYIWYSIAKVNDDEDAANSLREINWRNYLSQAEIRSANKEAVRRMKVIENREDTPAESPAIGGNIAIGATPARPNTAEWVFENTWQSVVVITNGNGQGSGVIIRPNIVATNCHVVDEGGTIAVYKSDNRRADTDIAFFATIRHSDTDKDFCLLDVDGLWGIPATVRKYDTLKIGETVYALGAPKGLDLSISSGLVSQLRSIDGKRYIQTDAATSPGSSGGGLFDATGALVGITTKIIPGEGIGFAIPADLALTQ